MKNEIIVILFLMLLIFSLKIVNFENNVDKLTGNRNNDLNGYLAQSKKIIGQDVVLNDRQRQYPPLYSFLLIPALFTHVEAYVLFLNIIISVLAFVPLWLITKRFIDGIWQYLIPLFVVIFDFTFSSKSFGYPIVLCVFLVSWLIYFLMNIDKKNYLLYSGVVFGLLVATKYVFFFMLFFIVSWIIIKKRDWLKSLVLFSLPSFLFLASWSIRNMLLYGFTIRGMLGGYSSLFTGQLFAIYPETIGNKLMSIFTCIEPNIIFNYIVIYLVCIVLLVKYRDKGVFYLHDSDDVRFHWLLFLNILIFFSIPSMMYKINYLDWRYLSYFNPILLLLSLCILVTAMEKYIDKRTTSRS